MRSSFCRFLLLLFLSPAILTAQQKTPEPTPAPQFTPGQDIRVKTQNPDVGGGFFMLYVPSDYDAKKPWPVIFFYNGADCAPSTKLFHTNTQGKGFIIVGMEYAPQGQINSTAQYRQYLQKEKQSIDAVKALLAPHLNIDPQRIFLSGISRGGWLASALGETTADQWSGLAVFCAGRNPKLFMSEKQKTSFGNKPIYIGAGRKDPNLPAAQTAADYYRSLNAAVTFEIYENLAHTADPDSARLRAWLSLTSNSAN